MKMSCIRWAVGALVAVGLSGACTSQDPDVPVPGATPGSSGVPGGVPGARPSGVPGSTGEGGGAAAGSLDPAHMPDDDTHRALRAGAQPADPLAPPPAAAVRFGKAPEGWVEERPASMRLRQLRLPRVEDDVEDGSVIVFFFGGAAGGVEANLQRWYGQFDGASEPVLEREQAGALRITFVDVQGTFVAETMPGSGERLNKPDFMLLGAIVEAADGNYFLKGVGPAKTMKRWRDAFRSFAASAGGAE
jgi:hypothetical protein